MNLDWLDNFPPQTKDWILCGVGGLLGLRGLWWVVTKIYRFLDRSDVEINKSEYAQLRSWSEARPVLKPMIKGMMQKGFISKADFTKIDLFDNKKIVEASKAALAEEINKIKESLL